MEVEGGVGFVVFEADEFVGVALLGDEDGGEVGVGGLEVGPFFGAEFQEGEAVGLLRWPGVV